MARSVLLIVGLSIAAAACSGDTPERAMARGDANRAGGRKAAAAIEYRNAIKARPQWADAWRKLGDAYSEEGRSEDAYTAYYNAIELDSTDLHSRVQAGRVLLAAGRVNDALTRAREATDRDPSDADA